MMRFFNIYKVKFILNINIIYKYSFFILIFDTSTQC